jgi:pyridinium-3,5-bisthiocarboxylic acid mononucleotide nickel chelatase
LKIAYFDCFSGVSGDMILGALVDAGLGVSDLEAELSYLPVRGFRLQAEKTTRRGISGTKLNVITEEHHTERHLPDMNEIIDRSALSDDIKDSSKSIFAELAGVEARIHHKSVDEVHFHEISGLDSIVDVVGSLVGLKKLGIEAVHASRIHVGTGFIECRHGTLPVPAPATLELLKGVPVYSKGIESELATPTGVAILKSVSKGFGPMPDMTIERVGYGAGSRELEIPNLLRLCIGETCQDRYAGDEVLLIETNIDDMNPEFFGHVSERLLMQGALDVFMTPIYMKKNRPATLFSVLTAKEKLDGILSTVFSETTTLGVRIHSVDRRVLSRETISVRTTLGDVRVKVGRIGGEIKTIAPEYEDCREIAARRGVPLKDVYETAKAACREALLGGQR